MAIAKHRVNPRQSISQAVQQTRSTILVGTILLLSILMLRESSGWLGIVSSLASSTRTTLSKRYSTLSRNELHRLQQQQLHDYLTAKDYVSPLEQYPPIFDSNIPLPPPLQAMQTYIQQHNRNVVLQELLENDAAQRRTNQSTTLLSQNQSPYKTRLYTVVYYSCPHSAGNWLHYFVASMNWAMLMNRTIVYKYMNANECNTLRNSMEWKFDLSRCQPPAINTMEHCTPAILTKANWMLSYEEISQHFHWTKRTLYRIPRIATTDYVERLQSPSHLPALDNYSYYSQYPVIAMYPWLKRLSHLHEQPAARAKQIMHSQTLDYLDDQLYAWGVPFYNGMVLRSCFDFAPALKQSVRATLVQNNLLIVNTATLRRQQQQHYSTTKQINDDDIDDNGRSTAFSIVLHSRHVDYNNAGCNIDGESACIEALMQQRRHTTLVAENTTTETQSPFSSCSITILSDRVCTINNLKAWLKHGRGGDNHCRLIVSDHGTFGNASSRASAYDISLSEHGPFHSDGSFFVDVLLASLTARHGMIAEVEQREGNRWRTSSELVEDFVAYSRMMEHWQVSGSAVSSSTEAHDEFMVPKPVDFLECTMTDLLSLASQPHAGPATLTTPLKVTIL
jgi:hypothetical protein